MNAPTAARRYAALGLARYNKHLFGPLFVLVTVVRALQLWGHR